MRVSLEEALDLIDERIVVRRFLSLSPTPEPVPIDILEDALRVFLEKMVARRPAKPGQCHGCMEDAVLAYGEWTRSNLARMTIGDMKKGDCFRNCYEVSQISNLRYAEGYALTDGAAEPLHHAWLVGPDGIEDPTWRQLWRSKVTGQPGRVWSGDVVYVGVSIDPNRHWRWTNLKGEPNLLSVGDVDVPEVLAGRMPWL